MYEILFVSETAADFSDCQKLLTNRWLVVSGSHWNQLQRWCCIKNFLVNTSVASRLLLLYSFHGRCWCFSTNTSKLQAKWQWNSKKVISAVNIFQKAQLILWRQTFPISGLCHTCHSFTTASLFLVKVQPWRKNNISVFDCAQVHDGIKAKKSV